MLNDNWSPRFTAKGVVLLFISLQLVIAGIGLFTSPLPLSVYKQDPSLEAHLRLFSIYQVAWIGLIMGLIGSMLSMGEKWLNAGYGMVIAFQIFWSSLYLQSWALNGQWRSVYPAAAGLVSVGILFMVSRMVEMPSRKQIDYIKDKDGDSR